MKSPKFNTGRWGPYITLSKVTNDLIEILLKKGYESRKKNLDYRKNLAGQVEYEFYYEDWEKWFNPKFEPYMNTYISKVHEYKPSALQYLYTRYPNLDGINFNDLELLWKVENLWINFQKQFENNPPHTHTGDLSFVIYLQVPKELVEENKLHIQNHTQNNEGPGNIVFVYGEELFMNINCVTKFPKRGEIIIFPAWLNHHVLSFKSDVERISVSGNIQLDIIKKGD